MRTWLAIAMAGFAGAAAAADWQPIGENANGNRVYLDRSSVRTAGGITTVTFRTELRVPLDMPTGDVRSLRSQMKVNCKDLTAAGVEVVLYQDEAKDRAFARNKAAKLEYLKEPAGSAADMVVRHVCGK
jgi:surface-adhesin protein E